MSGHLKLQISYFNDAKYQPTCSATLNIKALKPIVLKSLSQPRKGENLVPKNLLIIQGKYGKGIYTTSNLYDIVCVYIIKCLDIVEMLFYYYYFFLYETGGDVIF